MTQLILISIALIVSIIVAVQNADSVVFKALLWELEWPLSLLLLLFFAVGLVFGLVAVMPLVLKKHRHVKDERKKVAGLQQQVAETGRKLEEEHLKNREHNSNKV